MCACNSEILQKQAEQIKQQELEIAQQRKDLEAMLANQQLQDQKQQDCNRAFRDYFEKAQIASAGDQAIALYREGLSLCPGDEVAHYELGGLWPIADATLRLKRSSKLRSISGQTLPMLEDNSSLSVRSGSSTSPRNSERVEVSPSNSAGDAAKQARFVASCLAAQITLFDALL